jgi:hypothetical protein
VCVWTSSVDCIGTVRVWTCKSYLCCHVHVNTLVSRWIQPESPGCCDNQRVCVHLWGSRIGGCGVVYYESTKREVCLLWIENTRGKEVVYHESRKQDLKKRRKNEYRCDERLKTKDEESNLHYSYVQNLMKTCTTLKIRGFIIKSIKWDLKTRPIYDSRCDERLKLKDDESTCLVCVLRCLFIINR